MEQLNNTIEKTTLSNLITNDEYCRKVIPFIKPNYFELKEDRVVFEEIVKFVDKYKKRPTKVSLEVELENRRDLTDTEHQSVIKLIQRVLVLIPYSIDLYNLNLLSVLKLENLELIHRGLQTFLW